MGGVVNSKLLKNKQWSSVNGQIFNFYSNQDKILKYIFKLSKFFEEPIGISRIDDTVDHRVHNYDLSSMKIGHSDYRSKLEPILSKIDF